MPRLSSDHLELCIRPPRNRPAQAARRELGEEWARMLKTNPAPMPVPDQLPSAADALEKLGDFATWATTFAVGWGKSLGDRGTPSPDGGGVVSEGRGEGTAGRKPFSTAYKTKPKQQKPLIDIIDNKIEQ